MHGQIWGVPFAIYYTILAVFGVPGNLVTIIILSRGKCGLSRCITWYLVSMAVADLFVLIMAVILNRLNTIYFSVAFLSITPICKVNLALTFAAGDSSFLLTVAFTFNRFLAICCQKLKTKFCTERVAVVVIGIVCIISLIKNIPWYFVYEPLYVVNNVPRYCNIKTSFTSELLWVTFDWLQRIMNPCIPFFLMLFLYFLTVKHILEANRSRKRLRGDHSRSNQNDTEVENRRRSIVLLFSISGTFLVLWGTYLGNVIYVYFTKVNYVPSSILQETGYMLCLLSCCTNTCIYGATQKRFREELKNGLKYPLNCLIKRLK